VYSQLGVAKVIHVFAGTAKGNRYCEKNEQERIYLSWIVVIQIKVSSKDINFFVEISLK
jgi:hypothetical protein